MEAYAFYGCTITSIELPEATTIGNSAFSYCSKLSSINLPKVTSIDMHAFEYCASLTEISLATDEDVVLSDMNYSLFFNIYTTDITLTLGLSNSKYVDGNTLVVDVFSAEFKEIIIVDGDGEPF
ncbi:MAG: leucine-rich repeat domain-containing protein [Rikenellaceae bacterium]